MTVSPVHAAHRWQEGGTLGGTPHLDGRCGSFVVVGTARLPRPGAGDGASPLLVELVIDSPDTVIAISATVQLPGYHAVLRRLAGLKLADIEDAARAAFADYQGPLVRPTLAALANAVARARDRLGETPAARP